jgi:hypothetical protein
MSQKRETPSETVSETLMRHYPNIARVQISGKRRCSNCKWCNSLCILTQTKNEYLKESNCDRMLPLFFKKGHIVTKHDVRRYEACDRCDRCDPFLRRELIIRAKRKIENTLMHNIGNKRKARNETLSETLEYMHKSDMHNGNHPYRALYFSGHNGHNGHKLKKVNPMQVVSWFVSWIYMVLGGIIFVTEKGVFLLEHRSQRSQSFC